MNKNKSIDTQKSIRKNQNNNDLKDENLFLEE